MVGRKERFLRIVKDYRVVIWIVLVAFSLFMLLPPRSGVVVKSVSKDSPLYGKVFPGDVITWVNEKPIKKPEDFYSFRDFEGILRMKVNNRLVLASVNGYLGVEVEKPSSRLKFGLDIGGGIRVLLKPKKNVSSEMIEAAKERLEARVNIFGLKEALFSTVQVGKEKYIQAEIAGGSISDIKNILEKQGFLEAKIPKIVELVNGKGYLFVDGRPYEVELVNGKVVLGNKSYKVNETFVLDGIKFEVSNVTEKKVVFLAKVFDSNDVKKVCTVTQPGICTVRINCDPRTKLCEFSFGISISYDAAVRMKKLTRDMEVIYTPQGRKLKDGKLLLYVDKKLESELEIDPDLKGRIATEAAVSGTRKGREEAKKEMVFLQTVLSSGSLPVELEIVEIDRISPIFGEGFLKETVVIALVAEAVVVLIIFLRYRNPKIALPMIVVSASEVIIILGIASLINWTIDLPALAGILATIGTGVDAQIMIIDEALSEKKKIYSVKEKIKRAFFVIFSSAATTFVAMLPLLSAGAKVMQGFAVTTIIGLAVAVFVTRPAFGKIVEEIL